MPIRSVLQPGSETGLERDMYPRFLSRIRTNAASARSKFFHLAARKTSRATVKSSPSHAKHETVAAYFNHRGFVGDFQALD